MSLLGIGGLLGAFVGGLGSTQEGAGMTSALWVAAGGFGVAVVAGLAVLFPWKFHGGMKAETLVAWVDAGHSRDAQEKDLALRTEGQFEQNVRKAAGLQWGLLAIVLAIAVEFGALAYQLIRSQ